VRVRDADYADWRLVLRRFEGGAAEDENKGVDVGYEEG